MTTRASVNTLYCFFTPALSTTSMSKNECGLVKPKYVTVPVTVSDFAMSKLAVEWCAAVVRGRANAAIAAQAISFRMLRIAADIAPSLVQADSCPFRGWRRHDATSVIVWHVQPHYALYSAAHGRAPCG